MIIDEIKFPLSSNNFVQVESIKKQIVIANTFNNGMKHYVGWKHRFNGKYTKTAPFTISSSGIIYKHFNPSFQSNFFNNKQLDNQTIVILVENDGWLLKDMEKNVFITWVGDIYNGKDRVIEKKWRGYNYWSPYNNKQLIATIELVKQLCAEFHIPLFALGHNTKFDGIEDYLGVLYRSNIESYYTDVSPAWDFQTFKSEIEK